MIARNLDPTQPGEWLAAVGLASHYGAGRWVPEGGWASDWSYRHDGRLPTHAELADALTYLPEPPPGRWLHHAGQGSIATTARKLADALDALTDKPVDLNLLTAPTSTAGRGWMIDEQWRTPPAALQSGGDEPVIPVAICALALIGAHSRHIDRVSTWPWPTLAVGWLWTTSIIEGPFFGHAVRWRRAGRHGEPHAGALGLGAVIETAAPTWAATVAQAEGVVLDLADPVGAVEIAARLGVQRATVDQWRQRGVMPPPRWTVGGRPAWRWADIESWAAARNGPRGGTGGRHTLQ